MNPTLYPNGHQQPLPPFEFEGLKTYDLASRPSKVFYSDVGRPVSGTATISEWLESLPKQLAGNAIRDLSTHLCRAKNEDNTVVAAVGGHVIKTGCTPYLIDWIHNGILTAVAMNGAAAIHDVELALAGKTSEDVATQLPEGRFGMARETADVFALAARAGAENEVGLGYALGQYLDEHHCEHGETSVLLAAYRAGIPCTIHVAVGTDIVHMHPHVSGAALGESSMTDFRRLCRVVTSLSNGVWMNLGSAVVMPEVFVKAVAVAKNFGYGLNGLVTVNVDKQSQYRSTMNVLERPSEQGIEIIGHHEIVIPLLHAAVACQLSAVQPELPPQQKAA